MVPSLGHGFSGIIEQIDQYLYELGRVCLDGRQTWGELPDDLHMVKTRLMAHAADRLLQHFMDIDLLGKHFLLTGKIQEVAHNPFASVSLHR